jgi:hypothetical protein
MAPGTTIKSNAPAAGFPTHIVSIGSINRSSINQQ